MISKSLPSVNFESILSFLNGNLFPCVIKYISTSIISFDDRWNNINESCFIQFPKWSWRGMYNIWAIKISTHKRLRSHRVNMALWKKNSWNHRRIAGKFQRYCIVLFKMFTSKIVKAFWLQPRRFYWAPAACKCVSSEFLFGDSRSIWRCRRFCLFGFFVFLCTLNQMHILIK